MGNNIEVSSLNMENSNERSSVRNCKTGMLGTVMGNVDEMQITKGNQQGKHNLRTWKRMARGVESKGEGTMKCTISKL